MYVIIWKYSVRQEHRESFIEYYHSEGKWARFFHQATEYFGTDFFQLEDKSQFVTIDKWSNRGAYKQFLDKNHLDYHELDKSCEEFTTDESLLGEYFMFE